MLPLNIFHILHGVKMPKYELYTGKKERKVGLTGVFPTEYKLLFGMSAIGRFTVQTKIANEEK